MFVFFEYANILLIINIGIMLRHIFIQHFIWWVVKTFSATIGKKSNNCRLKTVTHVAVVKTKQNKPKQTDFLRKFDVPGFKLIIHAHSVCNHFNTSSIHDTKRIRFLIPFWADNPIDLFDVRAALLDGNQWQIVTTKKKIVVGSTLELFYNICITIVKNLLEKRYAWE